MNSLLVPILLVISTLDASFVACHRVLMCLDTTLEIFVNGVTDAAAF